MKYHNFLPFCIYVYVVIEYFEMYFIIRKWCHCVNKLNIQLYLRDKNRFGINNRIGSLANYWFWKIGPIASTIENASTDFSYRYKSLLKQLTVVSRLWLNVGQLSWHGASVSTIEGVHSDVCTFQPNKFRGEGPCLQTGHSSWMPMLCCRYIPLQRGHPSLMLISQICRSLYKGTLQLDAYAMLQIYPFTKRTPQFDNYTTDL